ncbi:hypothetical protein JTE90_005701 [Oedothorax gibbosus]|uniref:Uncharacterized protein n=1 Tax=Oedothorax gibbosus TaxID=931172 RepID=A0AAV6UI22_9ARAC|nr:hypothetical protein JTE90_005701 [Oedothorax gibbosus]
MNYPYKIPTKNPLSLPYLQPPSVFLIFFPPGVSESFNNQISNGLTTNELMEMTMTTKWMKMVPTRRVMSYRDGHASARMPSFIAVNIFTKTTPGLLYGGYNGSIIHLTTGITL